jgi:acetyl esterase
MYLHGGAWCAGSLDLADRVCRRLARASGRTVFSVGYALAPEHPYPAALDDCAAAWNWIVEHQTTPGSPAPSATVVGESAGANLAAALCLYLRDNNQALPSTQVLICPVLDDALSAASHRTWGGGRYLVTTAALNESWQTYLGGRAPDQYAAPQRATDLAHLPPAHVVVAECDPLHDDGVLYARRLLEAGTPADLHVAEGLLHGFVYMDGVSAAAARTLDRIAAQLRA